MPILRSSGHRAWMLCACIAACAGSPPSVATAGTVTWATTSSGSWTTPANWSSNPSLPGAGDDVTINQPASLTVTLSGGTQSVHSLLDDNTFTLAAGSTLAVASTFQVNGTFNVAGTLQNATLSTGAGGTIAITTGTFSNVTLGSNLTLSAIGLNTSNNFTLNSTLTLDSTSYYADLYAITSETLAGTGTVVFNGSYSSGGAISSFSGSPTLTVGPGITFQTGTGGGTFSVFGLVNQGTISAQTSGTLITISDSTFANAGTVKAINGATVNITAAAWSNTGTLILDSTSTLNLGGNFTTAGLGTISRTGGTLNLTGTLDNTGATLALNAATGSLILSGGTIKNGTVSSSGGAQLVIASGTLSNVTLATDIALNSVSVNTSNNLTLSNATVTLNSNSYYATLFVVSNETLGGNGTILFNGNYSSGGSLGSFSGSPSLTIGPGITVKTGTGNGTLTVAGLVNQGVIAAQTNGTTIVLSDTTLTNAGTLEALNGGTVTVNAANWSNTGTLLLDNASTFNFGGNVTTAGIGTISRSGGTINLTGTLDNTGATLALNAATGSFVLAGGTIKNGTVSTAGGVQLVIASGVLNNVTLAGDVTLNSVALSTINNLTLTNSNLTLTSVSYYGILYVNASETFNGNGAVVFNGSYNTGGFISSFSGSPTLTLGPGFTVKTGTGGGLLSVPTLLNQGTISAQTAGATIGIQSTTFTNTGTVQATNGGTVTMTNVPTNFAGGTLTGGTWIATASSTIVVPINITTNAATIVLDGPGSNFYSSTTGPTSALLNLAANAGSFTITNGRSILVFNAVNNTGTLVAGANSTFTANQITLNGGTLAGTGKFAAPVVAGSAPHTVSPGLPGSTTPGTLTLTSLSTNANTTLAFDLGTPASSDLLAVSTSGGLSLGGGTVFLNSAPANAATLGDYRIIQYAGTLGGSVTGLTLASSSPALHFTVNTTHDPGFIDVRVSLLGDANDDGHVDLNDLNTVLNNLGTVSSAWSHGNVDGAATIDLNDLNAVLNNLGTSSPAGSAAEGLVPASPTPEPGSLAMLALAVPLLSRTSRRGREKNS